MNLEEAIQLRDTYFKKWIGRTFPKKEAEVRDVWVIPKDEHFYPFFFSLLNSDECMSYLKAGGRNRDDFARERHGKWMNHDQWTIMLDLRHKDDARQDTRHLAKKFMEDEDINDQTILDALEL